MCGLPADVEDFFRYIFLTHWTKGMHDFGFVY